MIRRPPRSTRPPSSAASDVYKRQLLYWTTLLCHENDKLGLVVGLRLIALKGHSLWRWSDGRRFERCLMMMGVWLHTHLLELEFSPPTNVGIGVEGRDDATSNGVRIHLEMTSLTVKFWRTLASTRTHLSGEGKCVDGGVVVVAGNKIPKQKAGDGVEVVAVEGRAQSCQTSVKKIWATSWSLVVSLLLETLCTCYYLFWLV